MPEPRADMLPDGSLNEEAISEDAQTQLPNAPVVEGTTTQEATQGKGEQTPDNKLYAALQEEREKRRSLEARLEALEVHSQPSYPTDTDEVYSDEGKLILNQIKERDAKIAALEEKEVLRDLSSQFPELQGKLAEFNEYRRDFPTAKMESAAKLFLMEQGLNQPKPKPKGLEGGSGGPRIPESSGAISAAEIDRIRSTQPRLFIKMVREGKIDPDNIR